MKRRMIYGPTIALLFGLWASSSAAAPCHDVGQLAQFIAAHSDYTDLPDCIAVDLLDLVPHDRLMLSQAGAYDPATGAISVAQDLDLHDTLGQSYLLHELVHYAQFHSQAPAQARCPAELEAQAYALQAQFLRENGRGDEAVVLILLSAPLTTCGAQEMTY